MEEGGKALNLEELDRLVLEYASFERLVVPLVTGSTPRSEEEGAIQAFIRLTRARLKEGRVEDAIEKISKMAPGVLQNQRLLFYLHKQKFIELLRTGRSEELDLALTCARTCLAPCALNAYPEAYAEFKLCMLALIFNYQDSDSPVSAEWSDGKNSELAGIVSSTLTAHLKSYDSSLSLIIRYLIMIHKSLCYRRGVFSPHQEIIQALVGKSKDLQPLSIENNQESANFKEIDIQNLVHAVSIPRFESINSLKYTQGDVFLAFKNELSRVPILEAPLDQLIEEYCVFRGLVNGKCPNHVADAEINENGSEMSDDKWNVHIFDAALSKESSVSLSQGTHFSDYISEGGNSSGYSSCSDMDLDKSDTDCVAAANGLIKPVSQEGEIVVDSTLSFKGCEESREVVMDCIPDAMLGKDLNEEGHKVNSNAFDLSQKYVVVEIKEEPFPEPESCITNGSTHPYSREENSAMKNSSLELNCVEKSEDARQERANKNSESQVNFSNQLKVSMQVEDKMNDLCAESTLTENDEDSLPSSGKGESRTKGQITDNSKQFCTACDSHSVNYVWIGRNSASLPLSNDSPPLTLNDKSSNDDNFAKYSYQIHRLIKEGWIDQAIELLNQLDSEFLQQNFELLFLLKQVSFVQALKKKDFDNALSIAKLELGALATKYSCLFPSLKSTLFALANPEEEINLNLPSMDELANMVMTSLYHKLGREIPKLLVMMKDLIISHSDWLKLNRCEDELANSLGIHLLKYSKPLPEPLAQSSDKFSELTLLGSPSETQRLESNTVSGNGRETTRGESGRQESESTNGSSPSSTSSNPSSSSIPFSESSILRIMEVMEIPRGDAIELLTQFNGNVDDLFMVIFG